MHANHAPQVHHNTHSHINSIYLRERAKKNAPQNSQINAFAHLRSHHSIRLSIAQTRAHRTAHVANACSTYRLSPIRFGTNRNGFDLHLFDARWPAARTHNITHSDLSLIFGLFIVSTCFCRNSLPVFCSNFPLPANLSIVQLLCIHIQHIPHTIHISARDMPNYLVHSTSK